MQSAVPHFALPQVCQAYTFRFLRIGTTTTIQDILFNIPEAFVQVPLSFSPVQFPFLLHFWPSLFEVLLFFASTAERISLVPSGLMV